MRTVLQSLYSDTTMTESALRELSYRAVAYTQDTFSWNAVAKQYVNVLKGL